MQQFLDPSPCIHLITAWCILVAISWEGIFLGRNFLVGNYPECEFSVWELSWVGIFLGGSFPSGNHPGGNFLGGSFHVTHICFLKYLYQNFLLLPVQFKLKAFSYFCVFIAFSRLKILLRCHCLCWIGYLSTS